MPLRSTVSQLMFNTPGLQNMLQFVSESPKESREVAGVGLESLLDTYAHAHTPSASLLISPA